MEHTISLRDSEENFRGWKAYYYDPSLPAAVIFTALFGLTAAFHFARLCVSRTWFMLPFAIGGIFETIGYVGRALSATQAPGPYSLPPYIIQATLLLIAPALFAASVYMTLERIVMRTQGDESLFIRRQWLTKSFVGGDIVCFLMQAGGSGLLVSKDTRIKQIGENIAIAGLIFQIVFFGLFVIAGCLFHYRMRRITTSTRVHWQQHMVALYVVSVLIFGRSIVRVVEFAQGFTGYIMAHEVFIYVFDATPMLVVTVVMAWQCFFQLTQDAEEAVDSQDYELKEDCRSGSSHDITSQASSAK